MAKPRSRHKDYAVYLAIRLLVCIIQALSLRAGYGVAAALAWLAYRVNRRHRLVALDNLLRSFPDLSPADAERQVRAVYLHFCTLLIDIIHSPRRLHPHNWRRRVDMPNCSTMVNVMLSGRPVLLVTGHFGNWEMGGYVLGLLGFTTYAIARRLDNPYLDAFLRRFRERTGQQILDKNDDFEAIQAVLAGGGAGDPGRSRCRAEGSVR